MTGSSTINPHQQVYISKWVTFAACALLQVGWTGSQLEAGAICLLK
jgi:hypothetical protein